MVEIVWDDNSKPFFIKSSHFVLTARKIQADLPEVGETASGITGTVYQKDHSV